MVPRPLPHTHPTLTHDPAPASSMNEELQSVWNARRGAQMRVGATRLGG